jgi:hypothetical protein
MKNKERQKFLDEKKWNTSYKAKKDLSGAMEYCGFCPHNISSVRHCECKLTHEQRVEKSACAKAYNKMKKDKESRHNVC